MNFYSTQPDTVGFCFEWGRPVLSQDCVRVVLSSDPEKRHAFPDNVARLSDQGCAECGRALHPHMATIFRGRVDQLAAALNQDDEVQREQARTVIRNLIERIEIPPEGLLGVRGNLGKMLTAADGSAAVGQDGCGGGI